MILLNLLINLLQDIGIRLGGILLISIFIITLALTIDNFRQANIINKKVLFKGLLFLITAVVCLVIIVWWALWEWPSCVDRKMAQRVLITAMNRSRSFYQGHNKYPSSFKEIDIIGSKPILGKYSFLETYYTLYLINEGNPELAVKYNLPKQFYGCSKGTFCIYAVADLDTKHNNLDVLYIDPKTDIKVLISGYKLCSPP